MSSGYVAPEGMFTIINNPKPDWQIRIGGYNGLCIQVRNPPNRFQRRMQEMVFGFKWERTDAS